MFEDLSRKINRTRASIIAIGFPSAPQKITIVGSGFCVGDNGKILTTAHLFKKIKSEFRNKLLGMAMTSQEKDTEQYRWSPLKLLKKHDEDDLAVLELKNHSNTLLRPLELGDSEKVRTGEEAYFIGFPYAAQLINDGFGITLIVNRGMVSNIKRVSPKTDPSHKRNFFIIDAISNPGNSGSPLIQTKSNRVVGVMSMSFSKKSKTKPELDIREPMHICAAKPINLAKELLE